MEVAESDFDTHIDVGAGIGVGVGAADEGALKGVGWLVGVEAEWLGGWREEVVRRRRKLSVGVSC